jgi:metal-responsive CopG/Arc/MetJ family transcriptional regulator
MRTLVDIPEGDVRALDDLSRRRRVSRARVIRAAIGDYLARHRRQDEEDAFGLWGKSAVDGLEYERRLRSEW